MHSKRAITAVAAAALLLTMSGCAAPRVEAAPGSTPSPSKTALPINDEITDAHVCGQISAIVSLVHFARWRAETGQISELDHATIRSAAADAWQNVLTVPSAVGSAVEDARADLDVIMAAGGEGYVPSADELGSLGQAVGLACTDAGSQIGLKGTPGEG